MAAVAAPMLFMLSLYVQQTTQRKYWSFQCSCIFHKQLYVMYSTCQGRFSGLTF